MSFKSSVCGMTLGVAFILFLVLFLQVVSIHSLLSLVCGLLVSTRSFTIVPIMSHRTWQTLRGSLSGWKKLWRKLLRIAKRFTSFYCKHFFCHIYHHSDHHIDLYERCRMVKYVCGWICLTVLFSVGVHHRPCASRVPALCQKHHSYKRELQREAGHHL